MPGHQPWLNFSCRALRTFRPLMSDWNWLTLARIVSIILPSGLSSSIGWATEISLTPGLLQDGPNGQMVVGVSC